MKDSKPRSKKDLTERLIDGMKNKGDVTFLVGPKGQEVEISAFICILRLSSPIFDTMLSSRCHCRKEERDKVIRIPDIQPNIFRIFLQLLVTQDLKRSELDDLSFHEIFQVLDVAKKYQVKFLQAVCRKAIKHDMESNRVSEMLTIYDNAVAYDEPELEDKAFEFIARNTQKIFNSEAIKVVSKTALIKLLKSDKLVASEVTIFNGVLRWAREQCAYQNLLISGKNMRRILGEILFLIRFPLISPDDFGKIVRPLDILISEELLELYDYYSLPPEDKKYYKSKRKTFSSTPRSNTRSEIYRGEGTRSCCCVC